MVAAYREVTELVLKVLGDFGPMTAKELSAETGIVINHVSNSKISNIWTYY